MNHFLLLMLTDVKVNFKTCNCNCKFFFLVQVSDTTLNHAPWVFVVIVNCGKKYDYTYNLGHYGLLSPKILSISPKL